ncbi:MAG: efflux RND transporter periplasmic adaptor subunit [Chitinivibrionales bacterium]
MKKRVIAGLIVLGVVGLLIFRIVGKESAGGGGFGPRGGPRGPVAVQVQDVSKIPMKHRLQFTGTVKPSYSYVIAAKVGGRLLTVAKRIGEKVGRDEIIGRIDDIEYRQALIEAQAQVKISKASVAEARAQLQQARREEKRVEELVEKGISARVELESAQTQVVSLQSRLDLAQAQLEQRQAALDLARTRFNYTRLRSSRPGYVASREVDGGTLLSVNSPVLTVIGIDTTYVEIGITERDFPLINTGQRASVTLDALPGKLFEGVIRHTAPQFSSDSRTAAVELAIVNDSLLLKPGMFANITITVAEKDSTWAVPLPAVVTRDQKKAVFVADGNVARLVQITTGIEDKQRVEILSPQITRPVVTVGNHLLSDGAPIITNFGAIPSQTNTEKPQQAKKERRGNGDE